MLFLDSGFRANDNRRIPNQKFSSAYTLVFVKGSHHWVVGQFIIREKRFPFIGRRASDLGLRFWVYRASAC